jgi:RNA polymerase sigma factor (sigma-70 family)
MQPDNLIELLQKKDQKAFSKIYEMYSESTYGIIYNIVLDSDQAEEVLQDVFIKIWEKADTYSASKGRFFTWVLNIARNAAIDKVRSKSFKNSKRNLDADNFVNILEDNNNLNLKTDTIGLKSFVKKLEPLCIKVIDLLYFKGFTQVEASEQLDIPLGTIKTRNRNCLKALRANMGE